MIGAFLALAACSDYKIKAMPEEVVPDAPTLTPSTSIGQIIDACLSITSDICPDEESTDEPTSACVSDVDSRSNDLTQRMIESAKSRFSLTEEDDVIYSNILTGQYPMSVRADLWHMPIPSDAVMSDANPEGGRIAWRQYGLNIAFGDASEEFQQGTQAYPGTWFHDPLSVELLGCHAAFDYQGWAPGTVTNDGEGDQYEATTTIRTLARNTFLEAESERFDYAAINDFDLTEPTSEDFGNKISINFEDEFREDEDFDFDRTLVEARLVADTIADSALGLFGLSKYEAAFTNESGVFYFPAQ